MLQRSDRLASALYKSFVVMRQRWVVCLSLPAITALLVLGGCHLTGVGGASGALIGGAVGGRRGAMIGGGAGLLAGAAADALSEHEQRSSLLGPCERFSTYEERRACQQGKARAEEQNWRDRVYRAERYGYELHRQRTRY